MQHKAPSLSDFHTASKIGDLPRVKFLLSHTRVDINCREWTGRTPVMLAAAGRHRDVVEFLVSEGADVSFVDRFGINILHTACLGGDVELVKYVLSQSVLDINSRVRCGRTAVMLAARNGHKDVVELLVDKEADVSVLDETGDNILHCASHGGDAKVVEYILLQNMVDINSLGHRKKTSVIVAVERGHKKVVELLVKHEANLLKIDKRGNNILHLACYAGHVDVVKYVLSLNTININSRERTQRTPVMIAAERGHKEVVKLLVKHGADLSLSQKSGSNILHLACYAGHLDVVRYVLSLNIVNINSRERMKRTPVMLAANRGHKEVVELLVNRAANLLLSDKRGENTLHLACCAGHFNVVKYVLSLNIVNINSRERMKRTPVMLAANRGHKEVVELLVNRAANLLLSDKRGENTLHLACCAGHFNVVKYVLSLNIVNINSRERTKRTPVMLAANRGHKEVVELLVNRGANLLVSDNCGDNILHLACYGGHSDVVKYILSLLTVDINSRERTKRTPVMLAANRGHKEVVELLVNRGANLLVSDNCGDNILHLACYGGHSDVVKYILSLLTVDINSRERTKRTPVMLAANRGHKEVVELLVNRGANLLVSDNCGDNILHLACYGGHSDVVKYILSLLTVDINSRERMKRTPVMLAANRGHKEVVELLVNRAANLLLSDKRGENTLHLACCAGHFNVVKYVLSLNIVNINSRERTKRTPVMLAANRGHKEVVELLVNRGANLLVSDNCGDNILHLACYGGHSDVVKYILSLLTVDINSRERTKRTPVMLAANRGHKEVVELLVNRGANLLVSDNCGDNILHLACYGGHSDVVKYILSLLTVDINGRGCTKRTPVMLAAYRGHKEVVELLVNRGASLLLNDKRGDNILHLACYGGHCDVVKYILSLLTVDINSRGWRKRTPVMLAAERGHKEAVELLVKRGANLLLSDKHGDNILHRACYGGHSDVVKYILSLITVDINSRGWKKRTPVMLAAKRGHKVVVEVLVKHGADLLLIENVWSSLQDACYCGQLDAVKQVLLLNPMDMKSRGWVKRIPVMVAAELGHKEVVELLLKNVVNLSLIDQDGKDIVDFARQGGHSEVVQYVMSLWIWNHKKSESIANKPSQRDSVKF